MSYQDLVVGITKLGNLYSIINANFAAVITNFAATSFPAAPMTYQVCVRTDLLRMYYYDGDSWEDITDLFPDFQAVLSEVTAARGSAASLNARLSVALNPDGTIIAGAPAGGWWSTEGGTVARIDGTSFTVTGDKTAIYKKGRAVFLDQTTDAYGYVTADSTYAGSPDLTTVTIAGATVDVGLSSVQYGQPVNSAPQFANLVTLAALSSISYLSTLAGLTGAAGKSVRFLSSTSMDAVDIQGIINLKPVKDVTSVNKLNLYTKSGGAAPDATNIISVPIPDGNGFTIRNRSATYLSGTGSFTLADATGYWGYTSLDGSKYPIYLYAIWDGTGIVWALSAHPRLTNVTTTTTNTDKDYLLLEDSSTYSRDASHYCQLVGWLEAEYCTSDTPDWTICAAMGASLTAPEFLTSVGQARIDFAGNAKPGELELDGSSLVRATYPRLFTYFGGAIYGYADATHFYLPNPRGRFLRIWDHGIGIDPDRATRTDRGDGTTGDYVGTKQADQYKSHDHSVYGGLLGQNPYTYWVTIAAGANYPLYTGNPNTGTSGGNETRGININVALYIRY